MGARLGFCCLGAFINLTWSLKLVLVCIEVVVFVVSGLMQGQCKLFVLVEECFCL